MKAKNLYYVMALCAGSLAVSNVANAQDVFVDDAVSVETFSCDNNNHYFSNWRDNWFIEVSAGANQPLVERGMVAKEYAMKTVDAKKWTATYSVGVGRWMTPYLGIRLKGVYGSIHWDAPNTIAEAKADLGWSHMRHAGLHLELMWDMFNSFAGVNPNRVFSIIPFVGLGGDAAWRYRGSNGKEPVGSNVLSEYATSSTDYKSVNWTLPVSAGLQFRFRLCKYVDFFAEARATFYGDSWNNNVIGNSIDGLVSAMGGFNFNIGGRGWGVFNECNYVSQIAALNGQVNDLRAQLLACGEQVAALQAQLPCPEVVQKDCVNAPLMATVRFTINSDKILPTEEVNIYNMAEWLKANPKEKIAIVGYADKDTGTSEYNLKLSERRANAVAKAMTETYGIDPSRLTIRYDGSDVQPYSTNDWNRIVIFTQK
ncbi:MAG: OmpA family protein [Candidatus Amulumruptor caecigallinarius]|nr:OmpA family protein [Candidatus Amulumruptor caecigallinarius]